MRFVAKLAVVGLVAGVFGGAGQAEAAPPATRELRIGGDVMAGMLKPLFAGTQLRLTKSTRRGREDARPEARGSVLTWGAALGGQGGEFEVPSAFVPLPNGGSMELAPNDIVMTGVSVARSGDHYDVAFTFEEDGAELRAVPTVGAPEPLPELHIGKMQLTVSVVPGVSVRGRPVVAAAVATFSAQPKFTGACEWSVRGKKLDACAALTTYAADLGAAVADAVTARVNDGVFRANVGDAWWEELRARIPNGDPMWVRFEKGDALVTYAPSGARDLTAAR